MINRLYVHNFRSLENFHLPVAGSSSTLLIGRNGAGKTTVGLALEVLQKIARGTNRVGDIVKPRDLTRARADSPMRFEIEVSLSGRIYAYSVAFDYPTGFRELRVAEEKLSVDGQSIFAREFAQVSLSRSGRDLEAKFRIDWHLVALPIVQDHSSDDLISSFKTWLSNVLILRPVPALAVGASDQPTLQPNSQVTNLGAWFSGLLATAPSAYSEIRNYLCEVMTDFDEIKNPAIGGDTRILQLLFKHEQGRIELTLDELSDGERCFVIFALTIASNIVNGPLLCFWDEPDNFLAPEEIGPSIMALRRAFKATGQLIITSHDVETISRFSDENTLLLYRNSHLEPTIVRSIDDMRSTKKFEGGLVDALLRGDVKA